VLELADAITATPAPVLPDLRERLQRRSPNTQNWWSWLRPSRGKIIRQGRDRVFCFGVKVLTEAEGVRSTEVGSKPK